MMARIVIVTIWALILLANAGNATAQDGSPTPAACGYPDPVIAMSLGFADDNNAIALVSSRGDLEPDKGRPVRIDRVIKGRLEVGETSVDQRPGITCVQRNVYDRGETLLVLLVVYPDRQQTSTSFGLPVVGVTADVDVTDPDTPLTNIDVLTADGPRRLDELLEAGRAYVEPTPTLAPGQTSQPTFEVPDTGVTAPNTGSGSVGDRQSVAIAAALGALVLIAAACGVIVRRRA